MGRRVGARARHRLVTAHVVQQYLFLALAAHAEVVAIVGAAVGLEARGDAVLPGVLLALDLRPLAEVSFGAVAEACRALLGEVVVAE